MHPIIKQKLKRGTIALLVTITAIILYCSDKNPASPDSPIPGNCITVLSPNDPWTYYVGDTMSITWDLLDTSIAGLQIDFSRNGGNNYFNICLLQPAFPEFQSREILWIITDSIGTGALRSSTCSDSCRIFIHDYFNYSIADVSDRFFSIHHR